MDSFPSDLQEVSHMRKQNVENKMVGKSSHIKQRKLRSDVWRHFEKYKDKDGEVWAKCNLCNKDFDGSSRSGTTHLRNHYNSCQKKRNGDKTRESCVVYEANARVHGQCMEHRCGETISRLQEQIDTLQTQLAVSQAEVVYQRALRQAASFSNYQVLSPTSTTKSASPSSSIDEPLWSC
ncbi:hypothetical protein ACOSQ3_006373 [Xanthoceras sorbifolium]